jgi:hypothetical protein
LDESLVAKKEAIVNIGSSTIKSPISLIVIIALAGAVYACAGAFGGIAFCSPVRMGIKKSSGLGTFRTASRVLIARLISVEMPNITSALFSDIPKVNYLD